MAKLIRCQGRGEPPSRKSLSKALQYAASIEYRYFFLVYQAAGHRDFNTLALRRLNQPSVIVLRGGDVA